MKSFQTRKNLKQMPTNHHKIPSLNTFMAQKGQEYAPFDKMRVHRIYAILREHLCLSCKIIHILGTNGKGSTGRFITMGLMQQHKSVLHFSSPHLLCFNERFFINGHDVDDETLESAHKHLYKIPCVKTSSYFEYATFLALYLAKKCDYLVLEAGVGGEFDSTSVLKADLSVFTTISYDHIEMLGKHIVDIANTKLKAMGKIALLAKQDYKIVSKIAKHIAKDKGTTLYCYEDEANYMNANNHAIYGDKTYMMDFKKYSIKNQLPHFLRDNLLTAMRALEIFGIKFDFSSLGSLCLKGRCEKIAPNIVVDVGHNIQCARALKTHFRDKKLILVYNSYAQKDVKGILREFLPIIKKILIIYARNVRIIPKETLTNTLKALGLVYEEFDISQLKKRGILSCIWLFCGCGGVFKTISKT